MSETPHYHSSSHHTWIVRECQLLWVIDNNSECSRIQSDYHLLTAFNTILKYFSFISRSEIAPNSPNILNYIVLLFFFIHLSFLPLIWSASSVLSKAENSRCHGSWPWSLVFDSSKRPHCLPLISFNRENMAFAVCFSTLPTTLHCLQPIFRDK